LQAFDLAALRLTLSGADGTESTVAPSTAGRGEMPSATATPFKVGVVGLRPGERMTLWATFGGWGGPRDGRVTRVSLAVPGAGPSPTVIRLDEQAPGAPAWRLEEAPRILSLRAGLTSANGFFYTPTIELEGLWSRGSFVLGTATIFGMMVETGGDLGHYASVTGVGLRLGWLPYRWPVGLVGGVDGMYGQRHESGGIERHASDLGMIRALAVIRLQEGHVIGVGGGVLPVEHRRRSPFRSFTIDIGYAHWFIKGPVPSSASIVMAFGAPLFFF
jgi:hypothetical protein